MLSVNQRSGSIHPSPNFSKPETPQQRLLVDAKNGDQERLGELLESYRHYLNVLADSRLDRKLRGRLSYSDIVQETMLQAHRDFQQFRGSSEREFQGWLRRILAHTLAKVIEVHVLTKKRDVRRDVSMAKIAAGVERSTMQLNVAFAASCRTPSSHARQRERAVILAEVMDGLAPDQREVLILRNMQGLKFAEVAEVMGRSLAATKMLWMRSIKRLKQQYENRDEG